VVKNVQHEQMEIESQSSTDTNTTTQTVLDRFDALALVVQNLAAQVTALTVTQEANINKQHRDLDESARQILPSVPTKSRQPARSPPAKLPRARAPSPPTTPPPNGTPKINGAQEGV
jgi:hypothetical protein